MTRVDFHVNVADTVGYGCRLLRKIYRAGQRVVVCGPDAPWTERLDEALWTFAPADFIPHVMASDPLATETPVILHAAPSVPEGHFDVLVNLGPHLAAGFERCPRIIELVGHDDAARQDGRGRWRRYRELGLSPTTHDLGARAAAASGGPP
jgi:DNA polymerase-3 subunit chi